MAVAPLLVTTTGERARRGFGIAFTFGIAFMGTLVVWISIVGWVAWLVLVLLQAAFFGAFGLAWAIFSRRSDALWMRVLAPPVLWVAIVEFVRSIVPLGGFTWGQLAQSQHDLPWMLRPAAFAGGWAVAFIVVTCNALIAAAWPQWGRAATRAATLVAGAAIVLVLPLALPANSVTEGEPVRAAIVQGNVPRDFGGSQYDKELAITRSHRRLTEELGRRGNAPTVTVWPESSVGLDITRDVTARTEVEAAARALGGPIVVGGNIDLDESRYQVVAFDVGADGRIEDIYRKTHLVPFGEYVPARGLIGGLPILAQIPRDAVPSDDRSVFDIDGRPLAPVLSYEGDFGSLVRARIDAGGRMLVVATNTSTWGSSWASAQHVAFSQVRAAENGVWVLHAALSGVSAIVAPDGTVTGRLPLWTAATLERPARFVPSITLYARIGDWLPLLCVAATLGGLAFVAVRAARARRAENAPTRPSEARSVRP